MGSELLASVSIDDRGPDGYLDIELPGHGPRPWEILARDGLEAAAVRFNSSHRAVARGLVAVVVGDRLEIRQVSRAR